MAIVITKLPSNMLESLRLLSKRRKKYAKKKDYRQGKKLLFSQFRFLAQNAVNGVDSYISSTVQFSSRSRDTNDFRPEKMDTDDLCLKIGEVFWMVVARWQISARK